MLITFSFLFRSPSPSSSDVLRPHLGRPLRTHLIATAAARCGERAAHRQLAHPSVLGQAAGQAAVQGIGCVAAWVGVCV